MSEPDETGRDPRLRPADPAGTQPKHDPESLLPAQRESLLPEPELVEADVVEEPDGEPSLLPARRAAAGAPALATPAASTPWTPRFQFILGALVAVGLAAMGAIVILAVGSGGSSSDEVGPRWSAWAPTAPNGEGAQQIAQHVGGAYHLTDGRQLVQVSASPLEIAGIPLEVVIRQTADQGGQIKIFRDDGLLYRMCGLGPDCAIATGKPTRERHLLLRREALELALYSFRYLDVKSVVVFMPPRLGEKPNLALFFRPGDVHPLLTRPLTSSLAPKPPSPTNVTLSPDAPLVDQVTTPKIFTFSLTQANTDNKGFIVLDPFVASQEQGGSPSSGSASSGSAAADATPASGSSADTIASG